MALRSQTCSPRTTKPTPRQQRSRRRQQARRSTHVEEGKEEKEEVVVEEEDEASAPEPDDSTPCPVCCEYISAHEMHLHVNISASIAPSNARGTMPLALRLPSALRPEEPFARLGRLDEPVARLGRSVRPRSGSTTRTTRCKSSERSGRASAARWNGNCCRAVGQRRRGCRRSRRHASTFWLSAARVASSSGSRCGCNRACR